MIRPDIFRTCQISDGPGHFENAIISTGRQMQPGHGIP
jgi:hypothetical protein